MEPKERLKEAQKLVDAYSALNLDDDQVLIIRLFVEAVLSDFTVRHKRID